MQMNQDEDNLDNEDIEILKKEIKRLKLTSNRTFRILSFLMGYAPNSNTKHWYKVPETFDIDGCSNNVCIRTRIIYNQQMLNYQYLYEEDNSILED